mmetsp:Transcript_49915/g.131617  ORF Transcript_49915/g.131617 Transcript_49915/m.131617 type:complete len:175 (+) Transcript_49915:162-686(+)
MAAEPGPAEQVAQAADGESGEPSDAVPPAPADAAPGAASEEAPVDEARPDGLANGCESSASDEVQQDPKRRRVWSADKLPTRCEIMVYHTQCCDDSLLGSIELTSKHKLSDVAQLVRDELDVTALTGLFRGTDGDSLLVPLHKAQMDKLAIPLFGHGNHHIVVVEAEEDDGSTW